MPRPKKGRCTLCGSCEQACPTGAISLGEDVARVEDDLCIRCYCCHEVCPDAAIDLEFKGWGRVVNRFGLAG
jgi:ferredoxin